MTNSEIILSQTEDGQTKIDVRLEEETVWLMQKQMVELFQNTKQNIGLHIRNIFKKGELIESPVVKDYLTIKTEGASTVNRKSIKQVTFKSNNNLLKFRRYNIFRYNILTLRLLDFANPS